MNVAARYTDCKVAITRLPTNHPGDVQLAMAVDVPVHSLLRELYNCVIFKSTWGS
jgi:hypothetical protein